MKRIFNHTIFLCIVINVLFMNCVKEYSYEGGAVPGTTPTTPQTDVIASYKLSGAPNTCTGATLTGNYISGITMNAGNTAIVSVDVTAIGNYSLKTDTLHGISFSASGVFTQTGTQKVTMTASGTPERPDNISFTPSIGTSHCSFDVAVVNQDPVATYVLESGYGTPNPCIYTVAGNYKTNTALGASNTITMQVFVTAKG